MTKTPKPIKKPNQNSEIAEELAAVTEGLSKEKTQQIIQFVTHKVSHFSGPLPPPEIIKEYDKIVKNGAERIFQMAEKEQSHAIHLENYITKKRLAQIDRGSFFSFTLGLAGIISSAYLATLGHDWLAGIIATTTIGSLACAFIIGEKSQKNN
jgi:uncharacterized membrane protein